MTRGVDPQGATVVVTGASSGIGRAVARRFARKGSNLTLVARSESSLATTAEACRAAGAEVLVAPADVADADAVDEVADRTLGEVRRDRRLGQRRGGDGLRRARRDPGRHPTPDHRGHLLGTMWGTRSALRVMKPHGRGAVINVASLYGKITTPYVTGYSSSKASTAGCRHRP